MVTAKKRNRAIKSVIRLLSIRCEGRVWTASLLTDAHLIGGPPLRSRDVAHRVFAGPGEWGLGGWGGARWALGQRFPLSNIVRRAHVYLVEPKDVLSEQ